MGAELVGVVTTLIIVVGLLGSAGVAAPRASGRLRGRGIDDVGVGVDCDSQPVTP